MYSKFDPDILEETLCRYYDLVNKPYLHQLSCLPACLICECSDIRLLCIRNVAADSSLSLLAYTLNALASLGTTITYMLQAQSQTLSIYIGVKSGLDSHIAFEILKNGLSQTLENLQLEEVENPDTFIRNLLSKSSYCNLSAITTIPNSGSTTPILKNFLSLMSLNENWLLLLVATPLKYCYCQSILNELIDIYNILSSYLQHTTNLSNGLNENGSVSIVRAETDTSGHTKTDTKGESSGINTAKYTNVTPSTSFSLTETRSLGLNLVLNKACGNNQGNSCSLACAENNSKSMYSAKTTLSATNKTTNHLTIFTTQNKRVSLVIEHLNTLITRYQSFINTSAFEFGSYFLSPSPATCTRGAYTYLGLSQDSSTYLFPNVCNFWSSDTVSFDPFIKQLSEITNLYFKMDDSPCFAASSSIITTNELLNTLYFS